MNTSEITSWTRAEEELPNDDVEIARWGATGLLNGA